MKHNNQASTSGPLEWAMQDMKTGERAAVKAEPQSDSFACLAVEANRGNVAKGRSKAVGSRNSGARG